MSDFNTTPLVLRKNTSGRATATTGAALNDAFRKGAVVYTEKKVQSNASHANTDHRRIAKLDRDNEVAPPPKVDMSVGKVIQQGRKDKNLSQKDLAQKINEKAQVVAEYESGKATPNQQILGKMQRALGVKLTGKNIGEPLAPKGKEAAKK